MKKLLSLLLICLFLSSSFSIEAKTKKLAKTSPSKKTKAPPTKVSKKIQAPVEKNTSQTLEEMIAELGSDSKEVDVGLYIFDLQTGKVIASKNADKLFNPASNTKILTTWTALKLLGPNFRFNTQLFGIYEKGSHTLSKLILKGMGDPTFSSEKLMAMISELKSKGITRVEQVILDDSFFDGEEFPGQMEGRQKDALFNTSVSALSIDHNYLEVQVSPSDKMGSTATVELIPPLPSFPIENLSRTQKKGGRLILKNTPEEGEKLKISLSGSIALKGAPQTFKISVHAPLELTGLRIIESLRSNGILSPEEAKRGTPPKESKLLAENSSAPLSEIIQEINKNSDNFMAEQLTKVIGARFVGVPGSTQKGVRMILKELESAGISIKGLVLENGSGLSKENRVRPKTLTDLLQKAYEDSTASVWIPSLSVLGLDGTLRHKFRHSDIAGRFVGKTGTLNGVSSLSGYAFSKENGRKPYLFAFIVNGKGKAFWENKQSAQNILEKLLEE
ncbi:MAG: D-alanyl-D-alanine carboxypeptidase/D-alanyl-D-alanine-endopeptidase [Deltaproteobacteria bacterium]|nr:D-alanyl-D-alanine carboxypeptidase/D-alanyl-D-alanine-endopeptidase [Deltaproteobacteria bacterium]